MHSIFEAQNLTVWYGHRDNRALNKVSFSLSNQKINIILGQNGSGKSTLLRCLSGLQYWSEGEIYKNGQTRKNDLPNFNQDQIFISEDITLPFYTLRELTEVYSDIWSGFESEVFQKIISYGEIQDSKRFYQLSRGQKILSQFALGLASGCPIVLIDEVTAALDPFIRKKISEELISYQKKHHATVVLATNIATEFQDIYGIDPQIILLKNGEIYLQGPLSDLQKEFLKVRPSNEEQQRKFLQSSTQFTQIREGLLIVRKDSVSRGANISEITAEEPSLEEIFIFLSEQGRKK